MALLVNNCAFIIFLKAIGGKSQFKEIRMATGHCYRKAHEESVPNAHHSVNSVVGISISISHSRFHSGK